MPWFEETQTVADPLPVQQILLRQGDRLSAFAAVIEDEYGNPLDLTDARAYLTLRAMTPTMDTPVAMFDHVELTIEGDPTNGVVTYDWQASETMAARPGIYDVLVDVEYDSGDVIIAPSTDQSAIVNLRPSVAGDYFVVDESGALVPDGSGGFELFDPTSVGSGTYVQQDDGSYRLES